MIKLKGKCPFWACAWDIRVYARAFGGTIAHAKKLMHGKQSDIRLDSHIKGRKSGLPGKMGCGCRLLKVCRPLYRLPDIIPCPPVPESLPEELEVVALDCMEGRSWQFPLQGLSIYGLQFHPESILTPDGRKILENFLNIRTIQAM